MWKRNIIGILLILAITGIVGALFGFGLYGTPQTTATGAATGMIFGLLIIGSTDKK